jgi:hypothetical protein
MTPVETLLARLDSVRAHGPNGWRADCPGGHSSRGALSVGESDDGRVLVRCFAGCSAAEIVAAVGLNLADLFPARSEDRSPLGRSRRREAMRQSAWAAALGVLSREATIVEVAATAIERGQVLTPEDIERVRCAAARIHGAREVLQ